MNKLEYCRNHINENSIWRSLGELIPSKTKGKFYSWQFYLRKSLQDPLFFIYIGDILYDKTIEKYNQQNFQICSCDVAGTILGLAVQQAYFRNGIHLTHFSYRKTKKEYGLLNQTEGGYDKFLPVVLVDDLAASGNTMKKAEVFLEDNNFIMANFYVCLLNKDVGAHPEALLNKELVYALKASDMELFTETYVVNNKKKPHFEQL